MGKKIKCDIDRVNKLDPKAAKLYEKLRKKFEKGSLWSNIRHSPFFTGLYALGLYPRVLFKHQINSSSSHHPSLTAYQETAIRTLKRAFNSSLIPIRKNVAFFESFMKTFKCTEPITPLNIDNDLKGYWLGADTWQNQPPEAILFYVHGGPYISMTSLSGIQSLCFLLKTFRTKYNKHIRVLAIDYDLSPEEPLPVGLNYVERAYRWLVSSGRPGSQKVFLCGDSVGAVMVLGFLQRTYTDKSTTANKIYPLGAILISPWVELSCDSFSYFTNEKYDYLSNCLLRFASEYYVFGKKSLPKIRNSLRSSVRTSPADNIFTWLKNVEDTFNLDDIKETSEMVEVNTESNRGENVDIKNNQSKNINTDNENIQKKNNDTDTESNQRKSINNDYESNQGKSSDIDNSQVIDLLNSGMLDRAYSIRSDSESNFNSIIDAYTRNESLRDSQSVLSLQDPKSLLDNIINTYNKNESIRSSRPTSIIRDSKSHRDSIISAQSKNSSRPASILRTSTSERKRNSVRFSDFIEIHTPIDFDETPQANRTTLVRSNSETSETSRTSKTKRSLKRLKKKKKRRNSNKMQDDDPFRNPFVSPLHTPHHILAKYPPLFISYGGKEVLRDDIEMFCQKCIKSKKGEFEREDHDDDDFVLERKNELPDVVVEMDENMVHNYPILLGTFGEHSRNALTRMTTFIYDLLLKVDQPKVFPILNSNQIETQNNNTSLHFSSSSLTSDDSSLDESSSSYVPPLQPLFSLPKPTNVDLPKPTHVDLPKPNHVDLPKPIHVNLPKPIHVSLPKPIRPVTIHDNKLQASPSKPPTVLLSQLSGQRPISMYESRLYNSRLSIYSTSNTTYNSRDSKIMKRASNLSNQSYSLDSDVFANSRKIPINSMIYPIFPIKED